MKHVHRHMCDLRVGKISVTVMTTASPYGCLPTAMDGCNETLHNMLWNVLQTHAAVPQKDAEVSGVGHSSVVHADPVHPIDVLLGFNPANGQAKVMSGRCGTVESLANTCNMWSGTVMLIHSTVEFHVRNGLMLQNLVSICDAHQCTCHMHKSRPTNIVLPTP